MRKKGKFASGTDLELSQEQVQLFEQQIAEADAEDSSARVNFRWDQKHVDVIKAAADYIGVPYQTYIKMVIFEHAVGVLRQTGVMPPQPVGFGLPLTIGGGLSPTIGNFEAIHYLIARTPVKHSFICSTSASSGYRSAFSHRQSVL
jgi:predicted DNA binding CopG/RHH family protein